jgi:hypothetical protein
LPSPRLARTTGRPPSSRDLFVVTWVRLYEDVGVLVAAPRKRDRLGPTPSSCDRPPERPRPRGQEPRSPQTGPEGREAQVWIRRQGVAGADR